MNRRSLLGALLAAAGGGGVLRSGAAYSRVPGVEQRPGPPVGPPWPVMSEHMTASADGTRIFYRRAGSGATSVLFVHGWSCHHAFFGPQFAPVAARHTVLALDLAGHGRSASRRHPSMQGFADDVRVVAAATEGPLVLVVHSTGGRVACKVAQQLDDRLVGIIGVDTFQNLGLPPPTEAQILARLEAQRADFVQDTRRYLSLFFKPDSDPAVVAWVEEQMTATDPADAIAATEVFARFDAGAAIAGWPKPVIALNSAGVPTNHDRIREVLPAFESLVIGGRGHFPQLEDPALFNPLLLAMLARLAVP